MDFKKKYLKYKNRYMNLKFIGGGLEELKLEHRGNSWTNLKYSMHCSTDENHTNTIEILEKIGFKVIHKETDKDKHTFLDPPESFGLLPGTFMFIVIIKEDGNQNKLKKGQGQMGPHFGFRVSKAVLEDLIIRLQADRIVENDKMMIVKKPDETTFVIELPCGEVIEFSG
jgi:hypothetical protein